MIYLSLKYKIQPLRSQGNRILIELVPWHPPSGGRTHWTCSVSSLSPYSVQRSHVQVWCLESSSSHLNPFKSRTWPEASRWFWTLYHCELAGPPQVLKLMLSFSISRCTSFCNFAWYLSTEQTENNNRSDLWNKGGLTLPNTCLYVHASQQSCHTDQVALSMEFSFPLTVFTSMRLGSAN